MTLIEFLTSIADAIRAKTGATGEILATEFPDRIAAIESGTDTSDATATAADILSGKTAYTANGLETGTIAAKTSSDLTASGATVSVPAGHYAATASKSVATATQATPGITVSSGGLITASATQTAGYVAAGTKSATKQLTVKAAATITPGTSNQTVASGTYLTGTLTVAGDADLKAANIKSGVQIFGVTGTMAAAPATATVNLYNAGTTAIFGVTHANFTKVSKKLEQELTSRVGDYIWVLSSVDGWSGSCDGCTYIGYYTSEISGCSFSRYQFQVTSTDVTIDFQ